MALLRKTRKQFLSCAAKVTPQRQRGQQGGPSDTSCSFLNQIQSELNSRFSIEVFRPNLRFQFWIEQLCWLVVWPIQVLDPYRRHAGVRPKASVLPLKETMDPKGVVSAIQSLALDEGGLHEPKFLACRINNQIVWPQTPGANSGKSVILSIGEGEDPDTLFARDPATGGGLDCHVVRDAVTVEISRINR
jgi:hypothetical protein